MRMWKNTGQIYGEHVGDAMELVGDDVQSVVIPGIGHRVVEEAPDFGQLPRR
jgi:hypothetical protein